MNINDLIIPEQFHDSHFPHKIADEWFLVPNEARTEEDHIVEFECYMFNNNGEIVPHPYRMTASDFGFI